MQDCHDALKPLGIWDSGVLEGVGYDICVAVTALPDGRSDFLSVDLFSLGALQREREREFYCREEGIQSRSRYANEHKAPAAEVVVAHQRSHTHACTILSSELFAQVQGADF